MYTDVNTANIAAIEHEPDTTSDDQAVTNYEGECIVIEYGAYSDESHDAVVQVTCCNVNTRKSTDKQVEEAIEEYGRNAYD